MNIIIPIRYFGAQRKEVFVMLGWACPQSLSPSCSWEVNWAPGNKNMRVCGFQAENSLLFSQGRQLCSLQNRLERPRSEPCSLSVGFTALDSQESLSKHAGQLWRGRKTPGNEGTVFVGDGTGGEVQDMVRGLIIRFRASRWYTPGGPGAP